jgi:hypothetical protein
VTAGNGSPIKGFFRIIQERFDGLNANGELSKSFLLESPTNKSIATIYSVIEGLAIGGRLQHKGRRTLTLIAFK